MPKTSAREQLRLLAARIKAGMMQATAEVEAACGVMSPEAVIARQRQRKAIQTLDEALQQREQQLLVDLLTVNALMALSDPRAHHDQVRSMVKARQSDALRAYAQDLTRRHEHQAWAASVRDAFQQLANAVGSGA